MSKSLKLIIEALLFSSEKPLTVKDIKDCVPDTDTKDIKNALAVLEHDYEAMDRSYDLKEVAGGYQFRSKPEYGSYILRMLQSTPNRLSRAAMETLAIIAYKQPILRHEIEKLRGVDVGGILKTLMEKDLVKIMGRKDLPGKPLIYGTTKRFLEVFDLKDISDLPKMSEIKDFGLQGYEPTPQNRDNPLQPQGTEGLSEGTGSEPSSERSEDTQAQHIGAAPEQAASEEKKEETSAEGLADEIKVDEPVSDQMSVSIVDGYQETVADDTAVDEEYYEEPAPDDMPDEDEFFPDDEGSQEGYNDTNGDYYPDDDLSEDGNEDDPKD